MEKQSFILYTSFYEPLKSLNNEQLGRLLKSIFEYAINGTENVDNDIQIAFAFIKNQINIDNEKWQEEKNKRSEAGKKGMISRWNNKDNNVINAITPITNITDNVNENVNVNVNENVNGNNIATSEAKASTVGTAKASKRKYGEFKHVMLKDEELQKLQQDYANWEELIKYLDEYIEMKGYKAKSHYMCIKKWVVDAVKKHGRNNNSVPDWVSEL